jgi:hypothetical protein
MRRECLLVNTGGEPLEQLHHAATGIDVELGPDHHCRYGRARHHKWKVGTHPR